MRIKLILLNSIFLELQQTYYSLIYEHLKISSKSCFGFACIIYFIIKLKRKHTSKMAGEIIKIASSLTPQYDGCGEKLNSVVAALTALKQAVTTETQALAVHIILSKFEEKNGKLYGRE